MLQLEFSGGEPAASAIGSGAVNVPVYRGCFNLSQ
jgi:hypothetical protein